MTQWVKNLNRFQKAVIVLLAVLAAAYAIAYHTVTDRGGLVYRDAILLPLPDGSGWSGKVKGAETAFTFAGDGLYCTVDGHSTGPYILREDLTALPDSDIMWGGAKGIEILCGEQVLFRGGAAVLGDMVWMERADDWSGLIKTAEDETPNMEELYRLLTGPQIGRKGDWTAFAAALFISLLLVASILYADELFRFDLWFRIRDVHSAEPSGWEMASRYLSWGLGTVLVWVVYAVGLGELVI